MNKTPEYAATVGGKIVVGSIIKSFDAGAIPGLDEEVVRLQGGQFLRRSEVREVSEKEAERLREYSANGIIIPPEVAGRIIELESELAEHQRMAVQHEAEAEECREELLMIEAEIEECK